jgi:hypothetical protein
MEKMKANVFHGKNDIRVEEVERPGAGVGDALTTVLGLAWTANRRTYLRYGSK